MRARTTESAFTTEIAISLVFKLWIPLQLKLVRLFFYSCCGVSLFSTCSHTHLVQKLYMNCVTIYQILNWEPADQHSQSAQLWHYDNFPMLWSPLSYFELIICSVFASDLIYHINCPSWIVFYVLTSTWTHQTNLVCCGFLMLCCLCVHALSVSHTRKHQQS